jgi:hypothetical protein
MTINNGQQPITTAMQVDAQPELQGLTPSQRDWVVRLAKDPTIARP